MGGSTTTRNTKQLSDELRRVIEEIVHEHHLTHMRELQQLCNEVHGLRKANEQLVSKINEQSELLNKLLDKAQDAGTLTNLHDEDTSLNTSYETVISAEQKTNDKKEKKRAESAHKKPGQNKPSKKNNFIIGTQSSVTPGNDNDEENPDILSFSAVARKAWVYVGRTALKTQPEHLQSRLEGKFPGKAFILDTTADQT